MVYIVLGRQMVPGKPLVEDSSHSHVRYRQAFFQSCPLFHGLGFLMRVLEAYPERKFMGFEEFGGRVAFWWLEGDGHFEQRKQNHSLHSFGISCL